LDNYEESVMEYTMTEAQILAAKWKDVRDQRNSLLADTDWWATTDRTMSEDESTYRQALRDLPSTTDNPDDVVWPEKPE